jgi:hypothetical protein
MTIDAYTLVLGSLLLLSGSLADTSSFKSDWSRSSWDRYSAAWLPVYDG